MGQLTDLPKVTGMVNFKLYDKDGNLIQEKDVKNLVVTTGLNYIAGRLADSSLASNTQMTHMALGASTAEPALADTALGSQLGSRSSLTVAGGTPSGATVTYTATFGAGAATGAVTEAGIFNAATAGVMLCRTTFPVINKSDTDSLAVTWVITIS